MGSAANYKGVLASVSIQILHQHPESTHKRRTDLNVDVFVAESYPLELADKIVNFLPKSTPSINIGDSASIPGPNRKRAGGRLEGGRKRLRVEEEQFKTPERPKKTVRWADQPFRAPDFLQSVIPLQIAPSTLLPSFLRPDRSLAHQTPSFSPVLSTISTGRTITPGGSAFPSLRVHENNQTPTRGSRPIPPDRRARPAHVAQKQLEIPPSLAIPMPTPKPTPTPVPTPTPTPTPEPIRRVLRPRPEKPPAVQKPSVSNEENDPPKLVEFEPVARSIDGNPPKQTLILRHRIEIETLRAVFDWCKRSAETGRVDSLEGWLVKFRDRERVKDIREACIMFGLHTMARECERTIEKFENFGRGLKISSGRQETDRYAREMSVQSTDSRAYEMGKVSPQYRIDEEDISMGEAD